MLKHILVRWCLLCVGVCLELLECVKSWQRNTRSFQFQCARLLSSRECFSCRNVPQKGSFLCMALSSHCFSSLAFLLSLSLSIRGTIPPPTSLRKVTPPSLSLLSLAPPPSPVLLCCHLIGQQWAAPPTAPSAVPMPHPPFLSVASAPIGSFPHRVQRPETWRWWDTSWERERHSVVWLFGWDSWSPASGVSPAAAVDPEDAVRDGAPGQLLLSGRITWGKEISLMSHLFLLRKRLQKSLLCVSSGVSQHCFRLCSDLWSKVNMSRKIYHQLLSTFISQLYLLLDNDSFGSVLIAVYFRRNIWDRVEIDT